MIEALIAHAPEKIRPYLARFEKDRRLGVAEGKRQYDLPLNKDSSAGFLRMLIGLMSFLAVMALTFSFALDGLAKRWSSGLENKLTIEIPAETSDGKIRTADEIAVLQTKAVKVLEDNPNIKNMESLNTEQTKELIAPWFGEDFDLSDVPLPGLISLDLHLSTQESLSRIRGDLYKIDKDLRVDAHETWLDDVLKFTGSLQFAGLLIAVVILITTVSAVGGAVRSRLAVHKADVELLHLMGASDIYITRQFQRHSLILALQGSLAGTAIGLLSILLMGAILGTGAESLMPDMRISIGNVLMIMTLPILACAISAFTARMTVLKSLGAMP